MLSSKFPVFQMEPRTDVHQSQDLVASDTIAEGDPTTASLSSNTTKEISQTTAVEEACLKIIDQVLEENIILSIANEASGKPDDIRPLLEVYQLDL